jgi:hypothetical protein
VPGIPRNDPPWNGGKQKGHKRAAEAEARQAKIKAAMERMPQLIADYRVSTAAAAAAAAAVAAAGVGAGVSCHRS